MRLSPRIASMVSAFLLSSCASLAPNPTSHSLTFTELIRAALASDAAKLKLIMTNVDNGTTSLPDGWRKTSENCQGGVCALDLVQEVGDCSATAFAGPLDRFVDSWMIQHNVGLANPVAYVFGPFGSLQVGKMQTGSACKTEIRITRQLKPATPPKWVYDIVDYAGPGSITLATLRTFLSSSDQRETLAHFVARRTDSGVKIPVDWYTSLRPGARLVAAQGPNATQRRDFRIMFDTKNGECLKLGDVTSWGLGELIAPGRTPSGQWEIVTSGQRILLTEDVDRSECVARISTL